MKVSTRKRRDIMRASYVRATEKLKELLHGSDANDTEDSSENIVAHLKLIEYKLNELTDVDKEIFNAMMDVSDEEEMKNEIDDVDSFRLEFYRLETRTMSLLNIDKEAKKIKNQPTGIDVY